MKRIIIILLFVFCCAVAVFWGPLASSLFDWYLGYYAKKSVGINWHAEEVVVQGGTVRLVKPQLQGVHDDLAFHADRIEMTYVIHPLTLGVDFTLTVDNPIMALTSGADLTFLGRMFEGDGGIVTYRSKVKVVGGVIALQDEKRKEPQIIHYNFDYDSFDGVAGNLQLSFDDPEGSGRAVEIAFERNEKIALGADMQFRHVDGVIISQLAGIFSTRMREWQMTKGTLEGNLALQRMKGKRPFALGNLTFKDVEVHNINQGIVGALPLMKVDFIADKNLKTTTRGSIELVEPASFSFMRDGAPYFEVPQMLGALHIEGHDGTRIEFEGVCGDADNIFNWGLGGSVRFFDETQAFADLELSLDDGVGEEALVHCLYKKINGEWEGADIEIKNVGYREFRFVQQAIAHHAKEWNIVDLQSGNFDAKGHLYVSEEGIQELKINELTARNVALEYHPWDLFLGVENIEGTISVDLQAQDPFRTLNTDLAVDNGVISLNSPDGNLWQLTHLQTKVAVKNGVMQQSVMEGAFAGMRGTATLEWVDEAMAMNLHFEGMPHGLLPMLPNVIKKGFQSEFLDDRMTLTAEISRRMHGFNIAGSMVVEDQYLRSDEKIDFAFDLERANVHFLGMRTPEDTLTSEGRLAGRASMTALLPYAARPALAAFDGWVAREKGIAGYVVRNGMFSAKEIPLAKYVAPFAFVAEDGTQELKLEGRADFVGKFDHTALTMEYDGDHIVMEGEDFVLNTGADDEGMPSRPLAQYHLDFATLQHCGMIPVRLGTYLDKTRGLLFTDVKTDMKMEGERIHATDVECFCLGAYFAGDIDVDLSRPGKGVLDVNVAIRSMQAKVSQMNAILTRFEKPPAIAYLPLEGNITQRGNGGEIVFNVNPIETQVHSKFQAQLSDGAVTLAPLDVSMQELFFNIDFDHDANTMEILDLQGVVLIGKPESVEEYGLSGEKCCFTDYVNNVGTFDLWIGDRSRDIFRLAGTTVGTNDENGDEYITFALDPEKTHFGDVHPDGFHLAVKNWNEIASLKLGFDLHLSTLLHDLQTLSHSGVFFLSDRIQQQVNALKSAKGDFHFDFNYDEGTAIFSYDAVGRDIEAGAVAYQECRLNGKVKDDHWIVDQFKLDEMSLAAEIVKSEKQWKINFLGLQYGKSLLMGMEGEYFGGNTFLEGRINLLQMDLSKMDEWSSLHEMVVKYHPKGELRGNGTVRLETALNEKGWRADVSLSSSLKDWGVNGALFADADNFSCHYVSDRGLTVRHLSSGVYAKNSDALTNSVTVERIDHDVALDDWKVENLRFSIPSGNLPATGKFMHDLMGEGEAHETVAFLEKIKKEGGIQGAVNGTCSADHMEFSLALDDGEYTVDGVSHEVKDLVIAYDPLYLNMSGQYHIENYWPIFALTTSSTSFERGYIILSDHKDDEADNLSIHWRMMPEHRFVIDDALGTLCGVSVNLVRDPKEAVDDEWHHLNGSILCHLPDALPLLSADVGEKILQQGIGGAYEMKGKWAIARDEKRSGGSCFAGSVDGVDCKAKGYRFQNFKGEASYSPLLAAVHNVVIQDEAGVIDIGTITLKKSQNQEWNFVIPKFVVRDFRPSLLREVENEEPVKRNGLVLSVIEADGVQGTLSENNTWRGVGHFTFANPPKTSLQNTIFAVPSEIITRIGLNPAVLTPIEGVVQFEIEDGRILFKKFKDVYSDSRASKFYLPNTSTPSFLDFDGNINLQVRMKQYNILFKIAELFTVTVKGNLEKPVYTLRKQEKKGKGDSAKENIQDPSE